MEKDGRGVFIVFEGLDRCGKTTQINKIKEFFTSNNMKFSEFVFPDRSTPCGKMCGSYLQKQLKMPDHSIHLLFSANRWELREDLISTLKSGKHVICSRYAYSGVAYTSAKGLNFKWCQIPDAGLPRPDLVIYLSASVEKVGVRSGFGDEIYEKCSFQDLVAKQYRRIIAQDKGEGGDNVIVEVDAHGSIEEVYGNVIKEVKRVVSGKRNEIQLLWENLIKEKKQ